MTQVTLTPLPASLSLIQRLDFPFKLGVCERVFRRGLSPLGVCWVRTSNGLSWKLDLSNPTHRWIVFGKYEGSAFLDWARDYLKPDAVIVDSGANIGQMLLYLALWASRGRVLAFEPGKEQADWLSECLSVNPRLPVEIIRCGLGASPARSSLKNVGPENVHGAWSRVSEGDGEPIQIVRLEDELAARGVGQVDLWKLDVEGYEVPALRGAESLLKGHRIKALYVELAAENGPRVKEYLAGFGYECYLFKRNGGTYRPEGLPPHTNGLFLPARL